MPRLFLKASAIALPTINDQLRRVDNRVQELSDSGELPFEKITLPVVTKNYVLVGPDGTTATKGEPSFRSLTVSDIPARPWVNVKDYGAKGDAVTDDTVFCQAALNTGLNVWFPYGSYKITAALLFTTTQQIFGDGISSTFGTTITAYGAFAAFKAKNQGTGNTRDVHIFDMTINNSNVAMPAGSRAIDFTAVSYSIIERVSMRYHEMAIVGADPNGFGAYYNHVYDCEVASNSWGCILGTTANHWTIEGGRFLGNSYGVELDAVNTIKIRDIAFEHNTTAFRGTSGMLDVLVEGCHFEQNTNEAIKLEGTASALTEIGNEFAGSQDKIVDTSTGVHVFLTPVPYSANAHASGLGSGINLIPNGDFEVDADANGIADGWVLSAALPANMAFSLDAGTFKTGTQSQRFQISGATAQRTLSIQIDTTPGQQYVFSGWHRSNGASKFQFGIGNTGGGTQYQSVTVASTGLWEFERITFAPTGGSVFIWVKNIEVVVACDFWIDGFKLEPGIIPTQFAADDITTRKCTVGPVLTCAATITPTHRIHPLTGTTAVTTISVTGGFSGELLFIPDAAAQFNTGGNIANALTATTNVPVVAVWNPVTQQFHMK